MDLDLDCSSSDMELYFLSTHFGKKRKPRVFKDRRFTEEVSDVVYRQQNRIPRAAVDYLEDKIEDQLKHPTNRNHPLSSRQQILLFCQFLGTDAFYHLLRDARGVDTKTIHATVHRVADAVISLKNEIIRWPEVCSDLAEKFYQFNQFPLCAGALDGTHINVEPPRADEASFLNRYREHSINVLAVCGPDLSFYYVDANHPGRCHDSRVIRESSLWRSFDILDQRPFKGAVLLGDSAYPLREWLMTPFPGIPDGAKEKYNDSHSVTRNVIERAFGVVKKRFYSLGNGFRLHNMEDVPKFIIAAFILHNLAIQFGDSSEFDDDLSPQQQSSRRPRKHRKRKRNHPVIPPAEQTLDGTLREENESQTYTDKKTILGIRKREQLLTFFNE